MENNIPRTKIEINEYVQVYPSIKNIFESSDSKKYLYLFSQKTYKRASFIPTSQINKITNNRKYSRQMSNSSLNVEMEKEFDKDIEKEKKLNEKRDYFLINKDIQLRKNKSKRTQDIKHALESFLRQSDLIEKTAKFFEEYRDNLNQMKKSKIKKKDKKEEGSKNEEESEKHIEAYIESLISKLADNVIIEKYKKNQFVVKMNDIGDNCYFLLSGKLSVLKPVEYHIEITYDEYMQYIANLIKNNEHEIIDNIRRINQSYVDIGLVEDLRDFIKSYFFIKLKKDINYLFDTNNFDISFIDERLKLFNLSYEDFNLSKDNIMEQIEKINITSLMIERDVKEYFNKIIVPNEDDYFRLNNNPHILEDTKKKVTIYKYEDFLYLKPGCFFGETALDSNINKRNATIRTEEDCIILSLKNVIYQALLSDSNKKLKSFDVVFICKNFFFNDISPIIFNRRYFSLFKLINKSKNDILYNQSDKLSSIFFIKEGNIKLEINVSMLDIYNLIKYYYDTLTNNNCIKINQSELKEIKENYIEDKNITDFRHQSKIFKDQLKIKRKFELYSSNYFDTFGLEEFFLKNDYMCSCKVISNDTKLFEISNDSLNIIINSEKQIHGAYYKLIGRKLISLIKRLHMIKIYYVNQLNYKIRENFFNTEMPKNELIKGQTGEKKAFSKLYKKKSEPMLIKPRSKLENEEIKNDIFINLKKLNIKIHTRNKLDNIDLNGSNTKRRENLTYDNPRNYTKKFEKNKKLQNKLNNNITIKKSLDKNNNIILKTPKTTNVKSSLKKNNIENSTEMEKEKEAERTKRIMETTIIRVGNDCLSLKEIGKRVTNTSCGSNSELSIVKNFYYSTYNNNKNNSFANNSTEKQSNKTQNYYSVSNNKNNVRRDININVEPFSLKNNIMSLSSKNKNFYNNKLPRIPVNTYSNFTNSFLNHNLYYYSKYNSKNKIKTNLFKSTRYSNKYNQKKNYRTFFDSYKNRFNVILTNSSNPIVQDKSYTNRKNK